MRVRHVLGFMLGLILFSTATAQSAVIYESATLGATGITKSQVINDEVPASNIVDTNFVGARFEVREPSTTTRIGGHFSGGFEDDQFFGALVRLTDELDFPDSEDLSTPDLLGWTVLSFAEPSAETFGNLSAEMTPGWYAIVFGSGLFGTGGRGFSIRNGTDIGSPQYLNWQPSNGWFNLADLGVPGLGNRRLIVEGVHMPEPSTFLLASFVALFVPFRMRRKR